MRVLLLRALVLCASLAACGEPTAPPPPADIQISGQASWTTCLFNDCFLIASIQNVGDGCASQTSVVARLFGSAGEQIGADLQMGARNTSLSALVIRPNEIVVLASTRLVSGNVIVLAATLELFPTWNNVAC